ncbi:hypothetical protein M885DRAFT_509439 [Pelagophyceae sp. CCMP2097]|nr:hypothetical protein M885DRAFT_509439 [Pelagophyceae sp. CCMP2097]
MISRYLVAWLLQPRFAASGPPAASRPGKMDSPCFLARTDIGRGKRGNMSDLGSIPKCASKRPSHGSQFSVTSFMTLGPGPLAASIVREELDLMRLSGLLKRSAAFYVNAHDYEAETRQPFRKLFDAETAPKVHSVFDLLGPNATRWYYGHDRVYEFPSLEGIHQFCSAKPRPERHAVFYFHTKGSTKPQKIAVESRWRRVMTHFGMRTFASCLAHLDCGFDTCGANLEKRPKGATWPHYSGNTWWARCDYVLKLSSPRPKSSDLTTTAPISALDTPTGRFLAEAWIVSPNKAAPFASRFKNCWGRPAEYGHTHTLGWRGNTAKCRSSYTANAMPHCI